MITAVVIGPLPIVYDHGSGIVVFLSLWQWYGGGKEVGSGEGACPSPDYRNEVILSPPNTPFLLPVPIIYHTIIITNCCTSKLCLIFVTNIVFH